LIDSLHGLYDEMTRSIERNRNSFCTSKRSASSQRGWHVYALGDNRLLRRMIRDSWHRNREPLQTLSHWHYVRRSELKHIIPFIGSVDYIVNSAMPFELPILKNKLFDLFPEAMAMFKNDANGKTPTFAPSACSICSIR